MPENNTMLSGSEDWLVHKSYNKICILVHGFQANKNTKQFDLLELLLHKKGISTLRINQYGHGDDKDHFAELTVTKAIKSVVAAVKFVKKQGYKQIALAGSSFGGLTSFFATIRCPEVSLLLLKSPVIRNQGDLIAHYKQLDIAQWKQNGVATWTDKNKSYKLNYEFYQDANTYDVGKYANQLQVPTLIVHGKQDTTVPVEQSLSLKGFDNITIKIIPTAGHKYTDDEMQIFVQYADEFIDEHWL